MALGMVGCDGPDRPADAPVAHAYGNKLAWSELRRMIPLDAVPEDSAAMAADIITSWLHKQVLLHQAELNLPETELDFEDRLRDYRNSLVIYAYENALVREKLDTLFTDEELAQYHAAHPEDFRLKDNILRAAWFKVREQDRSTLRKLEGWFRSMDAGQRRELELWLAERGIGIFDPGPSWTTLDAFQREVPLTADLVRVDARVVVADSVNTYFVHILDHRAQDSIAPLELVRQDIRAILLNRRKLELLERMREDLYQQAWQEGAIGTP